MRDAGIDLIPSNTFSYYDQVLDTSAMVGAVPARYGWDAEARMIDLDLYFAMARGEQNATRDVTAMEMTKWFDTNYHYIVPELTADQRFALTSTKALDEYLEAREAGIETVPVLLGPVSYLLLGKVHGEDGEVDHGFDRLGLLDALLPVYEELLGRLAAAGAAWIQIDEPTLVQDRTREELDALAAALERLAAASGGAKLLVQTYFGDVDAAYHTLLNARSTASGSTSSEGSATSTSCAATAHAASTSRPASSMGATSGSTTSARPAPRLRNCGTSWAPIACWSRPPARRCTSPSSSTGRATWTTSCGRGSPSRTRRSTKSRR